MAWKIKKLHRIFVCTKKMPVKELPEELWLMIFGYLYPAHYHSVLCALPLHLARAMKHSTNNIQHSIIRRRMDCWCRYLLPNGSEAVMHIMKQTNVLTIPLTMMTLDLLSPSQLVGLLRRRAYAYDSLMVDLLLSDKVGLSRQSLEAVRCSAILREDQRLFHFVSRYLPPLTVIEMRSLRSKLIDEMKECLLKWLTAVHVKKSTAAASSRNAPTTEGERETAVDGYDMDADNSEGSEDRQRILRKGRRFLLAVLRNDQEWLNRHIGADFMAHTTRDRLLFTGIEHGLRLVLADIPVTCRDGHRNEHHSLRTAINLINRGADVQRIKQTDLERLRYRSKVLKLLFEAGIDQSLITAQTMQTTPQCVAVMWMHGVPIRANNNEMLRWQVKRGNLKTVCFLLNRGAQPDKAMVAVSVEKGTVDILKTLLNHQLGTIKEMCQELIGKDDDEDCAMSDTINHQQPQDGQVQTVLRQYRDRIANCIQ